MSPILLNVRWKSGVTFVRRCFRDAKEQIKVLISLHLSYPHMQKRISQDPAHLLCECYSPLKTMLFLDTIFAEKDEGNNNDETSCHAGYQDT